MAFTDKLLLWLHIAFAIFTLGPVTVATSFTPRYIRSGEVAVVRFLNRTTRIFGLLTIGVFVFGFVLGRDRLNQMWLSASMTLFIVAFALLFALVERDQRKVIHKMTARAEIRKAAAGAQRPADGAASAEAGGAAGTGEKPETTAATEEKPARDTDTSVQTGRIAALSGVIALIWLVILVLMVWFGGGS